MGFSRDFVGVRIMDDLVTVRVDATSALDGVVQVGDPATAITVSIVALPNFDVTLVSDPVELPVADQWYAYFPDAMLTLGDTKQVFVIGHATDPEVPEPYIWGKMHPLRGRNEV